MMDSLKVNQNKDGTYTVEWDKNTERTYKY